MSPTDPSASGPGTAEHLGLRAGMIVMESGYDDDVDQDVRDSIVDVIGEDLLDEDTDEVVDDVLVDSIAPLADDGYIWLLTPKRGRGGEVDPSDVAEASSIAGLSQTSITTAGPDWSAARLVGRKSAGQKK